jgi:hypothetical protein
MSPLHVCVAIRQGGRRDEAKEENDRCVGRKVGRKARAEGKDGLVARQAVPSGGHCFRRAVLTLIEHPGFVAEGEYAQLTSMDFQLLNVFVIRSGYAEKMQMELIARWVRYLIG